MHGQANQTPVRATSPLRSAPNMERNVHPLFVPILLVSNVTAQVVIPGPAATIASTSNDASVLYSSAQPGENQSRSQWIYDAAEVRAPVIVRSLQLRRSSASRVANAAMSCRLTIDISTSPAAFAAAVPRFDGNHGANRRTVFSGIVNFPAGAATPWPAPWLPSIVLSAPLTLLPGAGQSLVVDFQQSQNSGSQPYLLEAQRAVGGSVSIGRLGCTFSNGGRPLLTATSPRPTPGLPFEVLFGNYPTGQPSFGMAICVLGVRGTGQTWLGRTLPISLSSLGLPVFDPTCVLGTDVLATVPLTYSSPTGELYTTLAIPDLPGLYNQLIFAQPLSVDTDVTGRTGIHAGTMLALYLSGPAGRGSIVSAIGRAATSGVGYVQTAAIGTLRLNP